MDALGESSCKIKYDVRLSRAIDHTGCTTFREVVAETVDVLEKDDTVDIEPFEQRFPRPIECAFAECGMTSSKRVAGMLRELHSTLEEFDIVSMGELREKLEFADSFLRNL